MLNLKKREIPLVQFRRALPEFLGPGGECWIEVDARAGGVVNPEYMAGQEQLTLRARVLDRQREKLEDDGAFVHTGHKNLLSVLQGRFGVLYDTCVIDWRTNIVDADTGLSLDLTRANFLALTEVRVPEISAAMVELEAEVLKAGRIVRAEQDDTVKN